MAEGQLLLGFHAITARLRQNPASVQEIWFADNRRDGRLKALVALAEQHRVKLHPANTDRLDGMTRGARHQGVIARVSAQVLATDIDAVMDAAGDHLLLLVLDGCQDPHNLGACLRVADAFGVNAVVAPKDRSVGLTPAVSRVACGAAETVPYLMVTNLARFLEELADRDILTVGADMDGSKPLYDVDLRLPMAWVLGAEGSGLRRLTREHCDALAHIPMSGTVESLNLSVSTGICLAETRRRLPAV
ncbi:MAG: 23S rRNA (guanosine(2251)-2'-O)-methyltransferase RlmB [Betaproteobacteria bacterium]|jgi:23S rRNA (guanosine2251-2'-O)-methyltransferase|nr:23S rRNA (guanosine(2251)-2'-O)-methyltransferase RlmB [Betaproteobacteria bacterium]NBR98180.1 23S rRNA (guanosine(2251)-2'-O)-methyltransferase RlmB [Betaproteobacteria bacterium]NBY52715.1 23S rRNA (guanosine(2251)-2'-O)-methyltransferase RlmB [Betaproteobacteria bacterium]NCA24315.1 23S rRNA (guanosine(2251)-2'-O)-methyltransferase RlmB [Betaproteobacteria bacterium]NCU84591.1 23S rRNA (guanosine(2251)-2'-O)-methyltransferase RlmB [Betaproteobacteria bacterium]